MLVLVPVYDRWVSCAWTWGGVEAGNQQKQMQRENFAAGGPPGKPPKEPLALFQGYSECD